MTPLVYCTPDEPFTGILTPRQEDEWLAGLRPNSRVAYLREGRKFLAAMEGRMPSAYDIKLYLSQVLSPSCHNLARAVIISLAEYLYRTGKWASNPMHQARTRPKPYEPITRPTGNLEQDDIGKIFKVCRDQKHRAILAMLFATGARRSEIAAIQLEDYNHTPGLFFVTLRHTKTGRPVKVALPLWAGLEIEAFLSARGDKPGSLFNISSVGVYWVFKRYAKAAGYPNASPHWVRASVVTYLSDIGKTPRQIREVTGHNNDVMIDRYNKRKDGLANQASLSLPAPALKS